MSYNINNKYLQLSITDDNGKLKLNGKVNKSNSLVEQSSYIVAANPIDRMMNYTGSGLPFPCPSIAFDNTPNFFKIKKDGIIECTFEYPNSYHSMSNHTKIVPSVFVALKYEDKDVVYYQAKLNDTLPLKTTVTYRKGFKEGPNFYGKKDLLEVPPTQEYLLKNIGSYKINHNLA